MNMLALTAVTLAPIALIVFAAADLAVIRGSIVHRFDALWVAAGAISFLVLGSWGWAYIQDLVRFWCGQPRQIHMAGFELVPAALVPILKLKMLIHG